LQRGGCRLFCQPEGLSKQLAVAGMLCIPAGCLQTEATRPDILSRGVERAGQEFGRRVEEHLGHELVACRDIVEAAVFRLDKAKRGERHVIADHRHTVGSKHPEHPTA
jgi:hypothetical protein